MDYLSYPHVLGRAAARLCIPNEAQTDPQSTRGDHSDRFVTAIFIWDRPIFRGGLARRHERDGHRAPLASSQILHHLARPDSDDSEYATKDPKAHGNTRRDPRDTRGTPQAKTIYADRLFEPCGGSEVLGESASLRSL